MSEFRTIEGYKRQDQRTLSRTLEDYLEMICRLYHQQPVVRIQHIADLLHVQPSSVTKMAKQLHEKGYIEYEPYGYIVPTEKGIEQGEYLLYRHQVLHRFLRYINETEDELEQVELMEHFFDERTVRNIERLLERLVKSDPSCGTEE